MSGLVFTVGHSTRALEELLSRLREAEVPLLVDVRRRPYSRRHPHFGREALAASLRQAGIDYRHEEDLGGHRRPRPDSPHQAWRNDAFRGYADHMESAAFGDALQRLLKGPPRTAILCAEADPHQCHRQLVADALVARGVPVVHLLGPGREEAHALHPRARVEPDGRIVYPAAPPRQRDLFEGKPPQGEPGH